MKIVFGGKMSSDGIGSTMDTPCQQESHRDGERRATRWLTLSSNVQNFKHHRIVADDEGAI